MVDTRTAVTTNQSSSRSQRHESGFTLIEVLVAIVILGIVTTGAIAFSIQALASTSAQERRQVAVAVATNAMELVNAHVASTDSATGVSSLLGGRTQALVTAAWSAYSTYPGIGTTYPGWDPKATSVSTQTIPITATVTQNGTTYTVTTLIGWCYKQDATGDCKRIPTYTNPPAVAPAGWADSLIRVTAIVTWTAGKNCSATVPCSYQTITLIDSSADLEWNNS